MWKTLLKTPIRLVLFASSSAFAASYQQIDGTTIDPIQSGAAGVSGGNHPYSGNDLEPGADLFKANLTSANLSGAYLNSAYLDSAILIFATLDLAYLLGASLAGTSYLGATNGAPSDNASTDFTKAYSGDFGVSPLFDPVAAGWIFVLEPSTALLMGLGLAGLAVRRGE